jgi:hypothetical protein
MILVCLLVQVEWKYELWTFKENPITIYRKPKHASWFLLAGADEPRSDPGERGEGGDSLTSSIKGGKPLVGRSLTMF